MEDKIKILIDSFGEERVKRNEKLSYHTFSKLGGDAEGFYIATSQKELVDILDVCYQLKIPVLVLGAGTKMMISDKGIKGLVIKNRTSSTKIGAIKGKVGRQGIGVEEAMVEVDSGVSISKINEFLREQKLQEISGISSEHATLGGSIFLDTALQSKVSQIKVWEKGDVYNIGISELKRMDHIVLSLVLKVKATN